MLMVQVLAKGLSERLCFTATFSTELPKALLCDPLVVNLGGYIIGGV